METDYLFFQNSLCEDRRYRTGWPAYLSAIAELGDQSTARVYRERQGEQMIRGSHVMRAGNPVGLAQVNERLQITLPEDMDSFYRRWDGGLLLFRIPYRILGAAEIIEVNFQVRKFRDEQLAAPWRLVRFADVGEGDYLAMLEYGPSQWCVVFVPVETLEHILTVDRKVQDRLRLDDSFSGWLRRMCDTDGWPVSTRVGNLIFSDPAREPPTQRMP